jgi:hypothetical protein
MENLHRDKSELTTSRLKTAPRGVLAHLYASLPMRSPQARAACQTCHRVNLARVMRAPQLINEDTSRSRRHPAVWTVRVKFASTHGFERNIG